MPTGKQDYNIDIVDQDAKQIGLFWIFSKYIFLPLLVTAIGAFLFIKTIPLLQDIELSKEMAVFPLLAVTVIILLAVSK